MRNASFALASIAFWAVYAAIAAALRDYWWPSSWFELVTTLVSCFYIAVAIDRYGSGREARRSDAERLAAERERQRLKEEKDKRIMNMKQDVQNFMKAGRYEDAARLYDQLEMWEEAGECRKMARTSYVVAADVHVGKDGISVNCPLCGSSERVESKSSEDTCKHCGKKYYIPKKILDMI